MQHPAHHRIAIDDAYGTCRETWAELRLGSTALSLPDAAAALGLAAEDFEMADGVIALSSHDHVFSRDLRRHLDWLLKKLEGRAEALAKLRRQGVTTEIFCPWHGEYGGPALWPSHMKGIAELDLDLALEYSWADPLEPISPD